MKLWVFAAVLLALLAIGVGPRYVRALKRRKPGPLGWFALWLAGFWVILQYGFVVPVPQSVVHIYLGIATLALLAFTTSDPDRLERARRPLVAFMTERRFLPYLAAVVVALPTLVMANLYFGLTAPPTEPAFGRTLHPEPPDQVMVHEQPVNLVTATNPFRHLEKDDPEAFAEHVATGRRVYFQNCVYCHGDTMRADGMYAELLNPIPTNFTSAGTIEQLQESFLFWRIAKGGPGMPPAGAPWDSAMPAWEQFLSEDEMWDVILFLYDFTDRRPRAREETIVEQ
jgi:mono/diheme cytochrome c family protein